MPVVAKRSAHTLSSAAIQSFGTLTFTGNYTPGGVALNPLQVQGGLGSSPYSSTVRDFRVSSPLGYLYSLVGTGATALLKIYTAANTELGAVAFPEAVVTYTMIQAKV